MKVLKPLLLAATKIVVNTDTPSGAREVHASPEAVQKLIDDNAYTYHDCAKYPEVCYCIPNNDSNIC